MNKQKSRRAARKKIMKHYKLKSLQSRLVVHHIDGNPFNNKLANLRVVTRKQHTSDHMKEYWSEKMPEMLAELESLIYLYNEGIYIDTWNITK